MWWQQLLFYKSFITSSPKNIVIRNGKIVWKVVWIEYYLRLNLSSRRYNYPATSDFIKCTQWMCWKIKTTVFFMWPASWSPDISSFYYSDMNLVLIGYACCKLCKIWLLLLENNSRNYHYTGASHWKKKIVAVITQDRVIDDNLKRQCKSRTFYTCRLFPVTRIFQYIGNWSKVFKHLSTLFLQYTRSNNFFKFFTIFRLIIQIYI